VKRWILIGLALVVSASVVAGIFYFTTTPGKIDRSQNKVVPVALNITPAAQALQATLDVADITPTVCCGSATCSSGRIGGTSTCRV